MTAYLASGVICWVPCGFPLYFGLQMGNIFTLHRKLINRTQGRSDRGVARLISAKFWTARSLDLSPGSLRGKLISDFGVILE